MQIHTVPQVLLRLSSFKNSLICCLLFTQLWLKSFTYRYNNSTTVRTDWTGFYAAWNKVPYWIHLNPVVLFPFLLSNLRRVSMMIVLSCTEFDFLVKDSEFSFSDSGLWFSDFKFWFAKYMELNWLQTFTCGGIQILEEMILNVWNFTALPPSVPNRQNPKKSA